MIYKSSILLVDHTYNNILFSIMFFKLCIYFSQEQLCWVPSAETDGELPSSPPLSLIDSPVRIFIFGYISVYNYVTIFGFLLAFYKSFKIMLYIVDLNLRIGSKIKSMKTKFSFLLHIALCCFVRFISDSP